MPLIAPDAVFCRDEAEVYASFSHQQGLTHQVVHNRAGDRVVGCLLHPACERLPQPVERMGGAVPWGSNLLAGDSGWRRMLERDGQEIDVSQAPTQFPQRVITSRV